MRSWLWTHLLKTPQGRKHWCWYCYGNIIRYPYRCNLKHTACLHYYIDIVHSQQQTTFLTDMKTFSDHPHVSSFQLPCWPWSPPLSSRRKLCGPERMAGSPQEAHHTDHGRCGDNWGLPRRHGLKGKHCLCSAASVTYEHDSVKRNALCQSSSNIGNIKWDYIWFCGCWVKIFA